MKKTAIVYTSHHKCNTRRLVEGLAQQLPITLIDAETSPVPDLSDYDAVGFASGIDFGRFYPSVTAVLENLPAGKPVFFLYTCAKPEPRFTASVREMAVKRTASILGEYGCRGWNAYGPLKLIGGMNKGHPTEEEIAAAAAFLREILKN